jgi:hypothetical protein
MTAARTSCTQVVLQNQIAEAIQTTWHSAQINEKLTITNKSNILD